MRLFSVLHPQLSIIPPLLTVPPAVMLRVPGAVLPTMRSEVMKGFGWDPGGTAAPLLITFPVVEICACAGSAMNMLSVSIAASKAAVESQSLAFISSGEDFRP
jgi:hypothetical protein